MLCDVCKTETHALLWCATCLAWFCRPCGNKTIHNGSLIASYTDTCPACRTSARRVLTG